MAEREGQQLGNYQLLRLLGRGGYAEVYLAEHMYLRSHAAIKLLRVALQDEERDAFLQEAQTLAGLAHPHIVHILDFAVEADTPFLVMEYASQGTLRQRHPKGSRLPLETILSYVRQVSAALQYAHEQRLIHRDVKPENMLINAYDEVLLSDFGLATLASYSQNYSTHAMEKQVAGTSPYVSPELLQGHPRAESDQYALGVVVYEWLCGNPPFRGTPIEVAMQHLSTPPRPLREQVANLSPAVEEVVLRALSKDARQRFASVQDFAVALERAGMAEPLNLSSSAASMQWSEASSPGSPARRSGAKAPLRVLIADNHPLFRNGMRTLLVSIPNIDVVGVATNGEEAIMQAVALQPDVILMDLQMPGVSGIEATRRILQSSPHMRILIVTMFEDDQSVFTALRAGARGYVLKDADENEILRAIQAVGRGEAIFSPSIAQRLIDFFANPWTSVQPQIFPELTEREREILGLIAQGHSNSEIARQLVLSLKTVANHVSNIFSKLQVADRAQAIILARDAGLGEPQA